MRRFIAIIALSALLVGCRIIGPPGDVEVLSPYLRAPEPTRAVELYLEPIEWEQRPYEVIARMSTEVRARDFPTLAEAEAQGYERLRIFAARAGALAVINVRVWTTLHGEVVDVNLDDPRRAQEDYIIHMRAQAVRFRDQRE